MEHTLETLKSCPSCGSENPTGSFLSAKDSTYSKDIFNLVKCTNCSLVYTNPRPTESTIGKYYDNPEYVSHTDTNKGLLFTIYGIVKSRALRQKRALINALTTDKNALDYGAGSGDFSAELAHAGWSVSAFEPDNKARAKIAEKSNQIEVLPSIDTVKDGSKSIITLWHVLEHVHQLNGTIQQFNRILNSNGHLVIAVPNYTSSDAEYYKADWAAYDVPRHLYHFEFESIKTLIENQGFELKTIKPLWFDSFYVSLLSEKNRKGPSFLNALVGWINALVVGLISNFQAVGNTKKCSSIIYIFQKAV